MSVFPLITFSLSTHVMYQMCSNLKYIVHYIAYHAKALAFSFQLPNSTTATNKPCKELSLDIVIPQKNDSK